MAGTKSRHECHCNVWESSGWDPRPDRKSRAEFLIMATPRLRQAVPLPAPVDSTKLRQVLAATFVATLTVWVLPSLLLPAPWFPVFGVPEPALEHLIFVRLWGAALVGPLVGFALAWRAPTRHPGAVLIGIIANGLMSLVIIRMGAGGGFASWSTLGTAYIWGSALLAAGLGAALAATGQPLLRRLIERPRPGSVKVM